jgi:serine/threonine-protein kinase
MVGQTIGKYRVENRIGRGGMGTVYRAIDETLHREVAIKVLNSELNDPEVAKRFRAEAITVARLSHPGIATIYELFEHDGQWLMVMEFVKGETLERLVERAGPLTAERAAELAIQALGALGHAHSLGVVHRDLKPANLMLTEAGSVKIMDFGIARVSGSEHLTNAGFMMGTPAYMAPEQVLSQEVDSRADLYAIGVVIYRLTTGRLPFKGETPFALANSQVNDPPTPIRTARQGLPDWLELVIGKALAKSPGDRFQTAEDFQLTLQRCLAGMPVIPLLDATAETGMMVTPPPGLRSGALAAQTPFGQKTPTGTGASPMAPMSTGTGPMPAASPSGRMRMPTAEEMPTQLHSTAGIAVTGAQPVGTMPTGAQPAPVKKDAKKSSGLMMAAVAVVVVIGIGAVFMWSRRQSAEPAAPPAASTDASSATTSASPAAADSSAATPAVSSAPTTLPPPSSDQTAAAQTPASPAAADGSRAAGTPAGRGNSASSTNGTGAAAKPDAANGASAAGTRGTTAAPAGSRSSAPPPPTQPPATSASTPPPVTAPPSTPQPPIDDSFVTFKDVKFMAVKADDSQDQDALVNFGGGQITIVPKDGGAAYASVPYQSVAHATYSHSKDPKWDAGLPAPPDGLNIHGFLRGSRHWLTLQSKTGYVLLRLDDANFRSVLDTIENRCRLKVDRMPEGGH